MPAPTSNAFESMISETAQSLKGGTSLTDTKSRRSNKGLILFTATASTLSSETTWYSS